jgi:hypothetical protein
VIFSIVGTLAFLGLLLLVQRFDFNFNLPGFVFVALLPACMLFQCLTIGEPTTRIKVMYMAVYVLDALYYGLVLLIVWRLLIRLLKPRASRSTS